MSQYLAYKFPGGEINFLPGYIPQGGLSTLEIYMRNFMLLFVTFGVFLSLIYIVWGGMQWARSGGDKQQLQSAKTKIQWAITGLIVLFLSYAIVGIVGYLFKVDLLSLT